MAAMERPFTLAVLRVPDQTANDARSKPVMKYQSLPLCSSEPVLSFSQLPETHFVSRWDDSCADSGRQNSGRQKSMEKTCFKPARLSQTAATDAAVFLSGDYPGAKRTKKNRSVKTSTSTTASVTNEVLIMSSTTGDSTFRKAQYHAFTFSFPQSEFSLSGPVQEFQSFRQLLEIRQCGLQRSGAMSLSKDLLSFESFDTVEICTGMCLFSEPNLNICIQNGTIRPDLLAVQPFSLSEMDIIIRLATTIANMAALYLYGIKTGRSRPMRINIDIPCMQYYQNALESFESGNCSASDVLEWTTVIKKRRLSLFRAFRNAIEYALLQRGLKEDSVDIVLSCGLQAAEESILRKVLGQPGPVNWIKEILNSVLDDSEEFWQEAINLQEEKEQDPSSWRQFSTLSYVYEVLKPVLRSRQAINTTGAPKDNDSGDIKTPEEVPLVAKSAPPSPKSRSTNYTSYFDTRNGIDSTTPHRVLILAVDDQDESRIYTKANGALSKLNVTSARSPGAGPLSGTPTVARVLTVYPAPHVVVGTNDLVANWRRPSLWRAPLKSFGERDTDLQFQSEEGSIESCCDLLKRVYDADLVERLQSWLHK